MDCIYFGDLYRRHDCCGAFIIFGPGQYFYKKFHLDLNLIFASAVMCVLQMGVILDFILISRNQERAVFVAACWYILVFGAAVWFVLWLKLSLVDFIWLLVVAKLFHIAAQMGYIASMWRAQKTSLGGN